MVEIFYKPILPEIPFLLELADDLEGILCTIAYAGHEDNLNYIRDRQKYLEEKYGKHIPHLVSEVGTNHIQPAYENFQYLLQRDLTPPEIQRECERMMIEHLIGEEPSEDYNETFQEFYNKYPETL